MPSAIRHFVLAFLIAALIFGVVGALGLGWFGKAVREKEKNHITDTTEDEKEDGTGEDQTGQEGRPSLRGQSFSMLLILNGTGTDGHIGQNIA